MNLMFKSNKLVFFKDGSLTLAVPVSLEQDTVWLSRAQIATLYDRDIKTIGKHIHNALKEELDNSTVAKFATLQKEGNRDVERTIEYYNLDMIISIGYRVKSKRGVAFRHWANSILRNFILKGYAVNQQRLEQLNSVVQIMKHTEQLDTQQVLNVVEQYTLALDMLDDYDHQRLLKPQGTLSCYTLTYPECRELIDQMRFGAESSLFGNEKDESFKSTIGAIYQSFDNKEVYPTAEEKAANLLYLITKNHSFSDMVINASRQPSSSFSCKRMASSFAMEHNLSATTL